MKVFMALQEILEYTPYKRRINRLRKSNISPPSFIENGDLIKWSKNL